MMKRRLREGVEVLSFRVRTRLMRTRGADAPQFICSWGIIGFVSLALAAGYAVLVPVRCSSGTDSGRKNLRQDFRR